MSNASGIDVSIIIVSWNAKDLLRECLESIHEQTSKYSIEVIVVDNASTDGCCDIVEEEFPAVKLIQADENHGFAKANNIGIRESKGRYVCLMNSDIKILGNSIALLCDFMDQHPSVGIVGPKLFSVDLTLQISCKKYPNLWNSFCEAVGLHRISRRYPMFTGNDMAYFGHNEIRNVEAISGAFLMARRDAIERVGLLDESFFFYAEDIDWCKRFWDKGWGVLFFPDAQAIHHGGGSSKLQPDKFAKERIRAIEKFWTKQNTRVIKWAVLISILFIHLILRFVIKSLVYLFRPSERVRTAQQIKQNAAMISSLLETRSV